SRPPPSGPAARLRTAPASPAARFAGWRRARSARSAHQGCPPPPPSASRPSPPERGRYGGDSQNHRGYSRSGSNGSYAPSIIIGRTAATPPIPGVQISSGGPGGEAPPASAGPQGPAKRSADQR